MTAASRAVPIWHTASPLGLTVAFMNFVPNTISVDSTVARMIRRRRAAIDPITFSAIASLFEFGTVLAISVATGVLYHLIAHNEVGVLTYYLQVGALGGLIYTLANSARGDYRLGNFLGGKAPSSRILINWHMTLLCLFAIGFLTQLSAIYSRAWIALFYLCGLAVLLPSRRLLTAATLYGTRHGVIAAKKIFIVGSETRVADFLQRYRPSQFGVEVAGCCFLPMLPGRLSATSGESLNRGLEDALVRARNLNPDAIFLLVPWTASDAVKYSAGMFASLPAELHLGPDRMIQEFSNAELMQLGPISTLQLAGPPLGPMQRSAKRVLDVVISLSALIVLSPLFLVVACLIKLDGKGPVYFLQRRYGYNQRTFRIVKFRTMGVMEDGADIRQAKPGDERVTAIGRWLRRWNIDELPQLLNVLRGDMSLVGPRPHALSHNLEYEKKISLYARRHNVKPGITGWAQVHGYRGETDADRMRKRVEYDLYYIENWSLWLDIQILVRTALSPTAYRNAY
jgi:Undecaprenyl-phosphate glucose phosphotransferase